MFTMLRHQQKEEAPNRVGACGQPGERTSGKGAPPRGGHAAKAFERVISLSEERRQHASCV